MLSEVTNSTNASLIPGTQPASPTKQSSSWNPFSYLFQGAKYYSVKSILPFWRYFTGFDVEKLQTDLYKDHSELNWKMGSLAPVTLIELLTKTIVNHIEDKAKNNDVFYTPSNEELNNLHVVISATLTKILLNLNNNHPVADPLKNILKTLAHLAQKHFPAIAAQLPNIRKIADQREQKRLLKDLFAPLAVDFFKLTLPNGKNDLPLPYPIKDLVWDFLKTLFYQDKDKPQGKMEYVKSVAYKAVTPADFISPTFVFDLHDTLMTPLLNDGTKELAQIKGGEFWTQLSQFITNKTADNVPSILKQKRDLLAKEIVNALEINSIDKPIMESWFSQMISLVEDEQLTPIWHFIARYLTATINHRFINMHESEYAEAKTLFSHIKNTVRPAVAEIENDPSPENRKARLLELFKPLSDQLIIFSGLEQENNLRFPFFTKEFIKLITLARRQFLPEFLLDFYHDITVPQRTFPALDRRLKVLFFDENFALDHLSNEERANSLLALYHNIGDPQNELWKKSGVADLSREIENGLGLISRSLKEIIKNYLRNDAQNAAQLLIDFFPKKHLTPSEHLWFSMLVKQAVESGDPFVEQTLTDIGIVIERAMLHVFVYVGERTEKVILPAAGEHSQKYLLANIAIRLLDVIHRRPNITIQVEQCRLIQNPEERQQKMRTVFQPLATEFLQVAVENPLNDLPMLRYLKNDLWEAIQTKIVPDLLEKVYQRLNFWQTRAESSKQILRQIFDSSHPEEASKVIAHFGSEYIPYYLTFAHEDVALKLKQQADEWFQDDADIANYLRVNQNAIVKLLGSNIHQYGESLHPAIQANKPYTTKMLDGLVLKLMSKLAAKIHLTEQQKPNFMVESFKSLLEVTTTHFLSVNRATHNNRLKHAWNVPYDQMVAAFGPTLHRGIPNPNLSKEEQARHRMDNFYKPVTQRLFRILDIENDLEFKEFLDFEPMRKVWSVVQEQLFPTLIQSLFEKLMEPHSIRTMLLNSLETLNTALNAIPSQEQQPVDDVPDQPQLNETCGQLVLQLLGLVPRTLAHSVFEIDRVQKIAAQTIGSAISKTLRQWTWIKIIDKGIYNGTPNFRMGRWEGADRIEKFVPLKILAAAGPDGRVVIEPDQLTFNFPKTEQGKAVLEAKKHLDERSTEVRLKHLMAVMTSRQIKSTIESIVKKYWDMIQNFVDETIQLYFGLVGLKAKEGLDLVFGMIVFDLLVPILEFIVAPFSILFWYLLEEFLAARADDLSRDAIHRIQENLFFGLMDKFLDNFDPQVA